MCKVDTHRRSAPGHDARLRAGPVKNGDLRTDADRSTEHDEIIHYSLKKRSFRHSPERLLRTPTAGYRNDETGALGGIGTEGDWWCSSVMASDHFHGGRLYAITGNIYPLTGWHRAFGFSVRCVQASTRKFFLVPAARTSGRPFAELRSRCRTLEKGVFLRPGFRRAATGASLSIIRRKIVDKGR